MCRFLTSGPVDTKTNVLLAFRAAILAWFSNYAFLAVLAAVNGPSLALAIEWGKEFRSN
jgi:hypothetical protein